MKNELVPYVGEPGDAMYHEIITECEVRGTLVSNRVYTEPDILIVETEYEVEGILYIATIEKSGDVNTFYFFRKNMSEVE